MVANYVCAPPPPFPLSSRLGPLAGGLGCCPLGARRLAPAASLATAPHDGILGLVELGNRTRPRTHPAPYLRGRLQLRSGCTSIHFGENQLSPGSIGISPLPTGHPHVLQHRWVRASTRSYPRFTLPMGSSPGFGSYLSNTLSTLVVARFRLAFALAPALYRALTLLRVAQPTRLLPPYTRRIILQKARRQAVAPPPKRRPTPPSDCLSAQGFRGSFIPLPGCFSPFPHGTGSLSVARSIRALEGGPPSFPQGFSCPVVLRIIPHTPQQ